MTSPTTAAVPSRGTTLTLLEIIRRAGGLAVVRRLFVLAGAVSRAVFRSGAVIGSSFVVMHNNDSLVVLLTSSDRPAAGR